MPQPSRDCIQTKLQTAAHHPIFNNSKRLLPIYCCLVATHLGNFDDRLQTGKAIWQRAHPTIEQRVTIEWLSVAIFYLCCVVL